MAFSVKGIALGIGALYALGALRNYQDRRNALWVARQLASVSNKQSINIGANCGGWLVPDFGDVKCDIRPKHGCVPCDILDLSQYQDKQFSVAFLSHVLEHVEEPEKALVEVERIADHVVVVLPVATDPSAFFHPDHKWMFFGGKRPVRQNTLFNFALLGTLGIVVYGFSKKR